MAMVPPPSFAAASTTDANDGTSGEPSLRNVKEDRRGRSHRTFCDAYSAGHSHGLSVRAIAYPKVSVRFWERRTRSRAHGGCVSARAHVCLKGGACWENTVGTASRRALRQTHLHAGPLKHGLDAVGVRQVDEIHLHGAEGAAAAQDFAGDEVLYRATVLASGVVHNRAARVERESDKQAPHSKKRRFGAEAAHWQRVRAQGRTLRPSRTPCASYQ